MADDGSAEFRVAAALAGLGLPSNEGVDEEDTEKGTASADQDTTDNGAGTQTREIPQAHSKTVPPMAAHFAPIDEDRFSGGRRLRVYRAWSRADAPPSVVWGPGNLVSNMIAVLERRLVEATIRGLDDKPLASATRARLVDVAAFLSSGFDDTRCAALLAGMVWIRPGWLSVEMPRRAGTSFASVPFAYAVLKPIFTADKALCRVGALTATTRMPIPSGLISRLRAGGSRRDGKTTDAAVRIALARARGSGIASPFDPARAGGRTGAGEGRRMGAGLPADRLAAALLIPVGDNGLKTLIDRAFPGAIPEHKVESTEVTTDAA